MALISRNLEIQEGLSIIYDSILKERNRTQKELVLSRLVYKNLCEKHILNDYDFERQYLKAEKCHFNKFMEYDLYCLIVDILNDFRDLQGYFPEYEQMHITLNDLMLSLANEEKYELAAAIKTWIQKIHHTISTKKRTSVYEPSYLVP